MGNSRVETFVSSGQTTSESVKLTTQDFETPGSDVEVPEGDELVCDYCNSSIKMIMAIRKQNGLSNGQMAYGYELAPDGIHVRENAEEQKVIRQIKQLADGGMSRRKIVEHLNERGIKQRNQNDWTINAIARIVTGKRYG